MSSGWPPFVPFTKSIAIVRIRLCSRYQCFACSCIGRTIDGPVPSVAHCNRPQARHVTDWCDLVYYSPALLTQGQGAAPLMKPRAAVAPDRRKPYRRRSDPLCDCIGEHLELRFCSIASDLLLQRFGHPTELAGRDVVCRPKAPGIAARGRRCHMLHSRDVDLVRR